MILQDGWGWSVSHKQPRGQSTHRPGLCSPPLRFYPQDKMAVLLILIYLHEVLIYSVIFLISSIELWEASAWIMNPHMPFLMCVSSLPREVKKARNTCSSLIIWGKDSLLSEKMVKVSRRSINWTWAEIGMTALPFFK